MKGSIELMRVIAVILITFTHTRHNIETGPFCFIFETLPTYGTPLLSIISGFLFWEKTRFKKNIFNSKVASLIVPYFIANLLVLSPVLLANSLGYNYLNRLTYDYTLFTEGLLALNSPPINPPTYFIRDLFILFVLLELLFKKNVKMLIILLPLAYFGKIFIRIDIVIMFFMGSIFAMLKHHNKWIIIGLIGLNIFSFMINILPIKYPLSALVFALLIKTKFQLPKTGGFTYLLHLYHSPIMVFSYPVLVLFITNPIMNVFAQVFLSIFFVGILFYLSSKIKPLGLLSGDRT